MDKIPYIKFTRAEVKALQMTETADFTNSNIAGIKGKTKGLLNPANSSASDRIGLCQLGREGAIDAQKWAKTQDITINTDRTDPKNSIFLTAAYFPKILSILESSYNKTATPISLVNDCLDKKKMVFAAYNLGPGRISQVFKVCIDNRYTIAWDDENFQKELKKEARKVSVNKPKEVVDYITNIQNRLTPL